MFWSILVNIVPDIKDGKLRSVYDYGQLDTRWGDEAKFRHSVLSGNANRGLVKIIVYDVSPLWYKNSDQYGSYSERTTDDVLKEVQDHLHYCGHDVISCQLDRGVP